MLFAKDSSFSNAFRGALIFQFSAVGTVCVPEGDRVWRDGGGVVQQASDITGAAVTERSI